ncbi:MAG: DUF445 family protein [Bacteroidales bacterium]|nr:DUF445 family protein [Bacteroidales bacterium]
MPVLHFILGPAVGALIGGLTNKVAIRMLFRPHRAVYIGRFHVPFTPGIIPKEKPRIAAAIGDAVGNELLNSDVLSQTLLSDEMYTKISNSVNSLVDRMMVDPTPLRDVIARYAAPEETDRLLSQMQTDLVQTLCLKLSDKAIGDHVAALAIDHIMNRLSQNFVGRLGASALDLVHNSVQHFLADNINQLLQQNSQPMLHSWVSTETQHLLDTPLCRLCQHHQPQLRQLGGMVVNIYKQVVQDNLPRMLQTLDLQRIVQDRINDMDMQQTEQLILTIMKKELRALVWFGVLLGFLMGFITNIL